MDKSAKQVEERELPVDGTDNAKSETSTIRYEHEPFQTFQHKVAKLAAEVLHSTASDISIEHMKGGTYNRVVDVKVRATKPTRQCTSWAQKLLRTLLRKPASSVYENYIVRIQRGTGEDLQQQVAALKAVSARLQLLIPEVVSFDESSNNAIETPYIIQKRLPGQMFTHMMKDLNLEQIKSATERITELVSIIAAIHAPPGELAVENATSSVDQPIRTNKFMVPRGDTIPSTPQEPLEHLLELCETWREFQKAGKHCFEELWDSFAAISKSLGRRGFLEGPCVLVHGDFREYNLLARVSSLTTVEIAGIIDWDNCFFAPQFVAYRAPFWLWTAEDASTDDLDDEMNASAEPESLADQAVKQVFMEKASADYKRFAFAPEAILGRRMHHILRKGIFGQWSMMEARAIISEWDELHPEDEVAFSDDESDIEDVDSEASSEHTDVEHKEE
jgi:aminoglycoside phosphotransferase (APT) family kinase protein